VQFWSLEFRVLAVLKAVSSFFCSISCSSCEGRDVVVVVDDGGGGGGGICADFIVLVAKNSWTMDIMCK